MSVESVWASSPGKQESVRIVWPDLYNAIEALTAPATDGTPRQQLCPICSTGPDSSHRRPVVGRLWRNGAPACAECIDRSADRPGGWPLEMQKGRSS